MKYWAKLDEDDIVVEVINETGLEDLEAPEGQQASVARNTPLGLTTTQKQGLVRCFSPGDGPAGSYAAPGFKYDRDLRGFVPPQPEPSDVFDKKSFEWVPPKPDEENDYVWDNESGAWVGA
jgi:hypothetical protein